jgi:hypothetical protein
MSAAHTVAVRPRPSRIDGLEAEALPHLSPDSRHWLSGAVTATVRDAEDVVGRQVGQVPGSRQSRERTGAATFLTGNASAFRPAWDKL